jgi:ABC-type phosphate transport system ATPase subunit
MRKGTQARLLKESLDLVHISVGNIFRWHIQSHTKLGARIKRIMAEGQLVPDDGHVRFRGKDIYHPSVDAVAVRRFIGMVFQQPNPFAMSIYNNVAFGLRLNRYRGDSRGKSGRSAEARGALG